MSAVKKILGSITLLLVCLGTNIAYASLVNEMSVTGEINAIPQKKYDIYISESEIVSTNNTSNFLFKHDKPTTFISDVIVNRTDGTITYKITVSNDSNKTYWYDGYLYLDDIGNNNLIDQTYGIKIVTKDKIDDARATFDVDDWIPAKTTRSFYATYHFGRNTISLDTVFTQVNFNFVIRIDGAHQEFVAALNNPDTYAYIAEMFDKKYEETGETYIGNIGEDKQMFNTLFDEELTINVNGEEKPLTVIIDRKNVDKTTNTGDDYNVSNPTSKMYGCEYTLYLTVDDISSPGGNATVYAITYTCDEFGQWHKIAELYEGTCPKEDYDSSTSTYEGGFDLSKWKANAKEYQLTNEISYKVGQQNGDQYDIIKDLETLMSVNDNEIYNDIDNTKFFKKVYDILQQHRYSADAAVVNLREAFDTASFLYDIYNNGQEIKVKRNVSRAVLIGYIRDIADALDYYYQVFDN